MEEVKEEKKKRREVSLPISAGLAQTLHSPFRNQATFGLQKCMQAKSCLHSDFGIEAFLKPKGAHHPIGRGDHQGRECPCEMWLWPMVCVCVVV